MKPENAYTEVADFIVFNNPRGVLAFQPSAEAKSLVTDLIFREKTEGLSGDEKSELDDCIFVEHLMRLAKARARRRLSEE